MDDAVERLIRLADTGASPADKILALATGRHQEVLAHIEDQQAQAMVAAWQQARTELTARMEQLYAQSFGAGLSPEPKQVLEWTRNSQLSQALDQKLGNLGITTQALQGQAWSAGAVLGMQQANAELGFAVSDLGGPGIVGASTFGHIDSVAYDLGMTAAVNDTKNLPGKLRTDVQTALQTGGLLGEGIAPLTKRLDEVLDGATTAAGSRAEGIARWATIKGHNASREDALNDAAKYIPGLQKMWVVQNDERTCPHCMSHFGETIPVDSEFDKERSFAKTPPKVYGGVLEYPPLHPKCRCTIVAWLERWRGLSTLTPEDLQADAQQAAQKLGYGTKDFADHAPPVKGLRATRQGRRVLYTKAVGSVPESVRKATADRFLSCWAGPK